jgi:EAL domain-containing protein (putative c-di-GMP-specific phosphodiesterase class I)
VLSVDAVTKKVTKKKSRPPMQLSVSLTGDQRLTENLILEVRAMARRYGLETPNVEVVRQPRVGPKVKLTSGRKSK